MQINEIVYKDIKSIKVENDKYEIIIPMEYGIRILSFKLKESFNFLGENINTIKEHENGEKWYIRGGHRLWHTPEEFPRTYLPDNDEIKYIFKDNKLTLIQKINPNTLIQKKMELEFINEGKELKINHIIINKGLWEIETAAWPITILKTGGIAEIPLNKREGGYLSTKHFSLWSYCDLSDKRINFNKDSLIINQDNNNMNSFKIGTNNEEGWLTYKCEGYIFKKTFDYFTGEKYPDNGCSSEVYTDNKVLELETLSPIYNIKPNEEINHIEKWSINKI